MSIRSALWAAILLLLPASADAAFYFARDGQLARLGPEVSYRIDARPASDIEAISRESTGWISQKDRPFKGTDDPIVIWARFDIPPEISAKRVLMNVPLWEHEEFFVVRDGVVVHRERAGAALPWKERPKHVTLAPKSAGGFIAVDLVPGSRTTVFARLETQNRAATVDVLFARIWDPERVRDGERRDGLVQGIFYGIMLFLIAYNFGLYLVTREPSFLCYVVMEAGFAITWGTLNGLTVQYLAPNHPLWEFRYTWCAGLIGSFAGWQFLRHYLGAAAAFPDLDKVMKVLAYMNLAFAGIVVFPISGETLSQIMLYGTPPGAVVLVVVAVLVLKRHHPAARNLLVALSAMAVGFLLFAGAAIDILPSNNWILHAGQMGSAVMGVVLSMGLGFQLQEERTRLARLKRFLSPKVSELIAAGQLDDPLATRRREVTIVFVDLRGFTGFSETAAPEDVLGVLREYHSEIGRLVGKHEGTIEHFAGDGVMIIFNDPAPLQDPAFAAVSFAVELRDSVARLADSWRRLGHQLACGLGIAQGYATIGTIGFPGRQDYGVIGAVNNLAARLCGQAAAGQVLVSQRVFGRVEDRVIAELVGELVLKGIQAPVPAFNIVSIKSQAQVVESSMPSLEPIPGS